MFEAGVVRDFSQRDFSQRDFSSRCRVPLSFDHYYIQRRQLSPLGQPNGGNNLLPDIRKSHP
jgi:hypothetical protein